MWTIRRHVHPVGQVAQWVKKAGPVVIAPSSNPFFSFFFLRRKTFFGASFLKLQKGCAGKLFFAHGF